MSSRLRSTVIVPVLEASAAVDRWREQTCNDKPSIGVPAHITLIFPFVPATRLDQQTVGSLEEIIRETAPFEFELRDAARFPTTLFLVPDPSAAFARLTEAIVRQFPDYPPYGGAFDTIVPHLTVAQGNDLCWTRPKRTFDASCRSRRQRERPCFSKRSKPTGDAGRFGRGCHSQAVPPSRCLHAELDAYAGSVRTSPAWRLVRSPTCSAQVRGGSSTWATSA